MGNQQFSGSPSQNVAVALSVVGHAVRSGSTSRTVAVGSAVSVAVVKRGTVMQPVALAVTVTGNDTRRGNSSQAVALSEVANGTCTRRGVPDAVIVLMEAAVSIHDLRQGTVNQAVAFDGVNIGSGQGAHTTTGSVTKIIALSSSVVIQRMSRSAAAENIAFDGVPSAYRVPQYLAVLYQHVQDFNQNYYSIVGQGWKIDTVTIFSNGPGLCVIWTQ